MTSISKTALDFNRIYVQQLFSGSPPPPQSYSSPRTDVHLNTSVAGNKLGRILWGMACRNPSSRFVSFRCNVSHQRSPSLSPTTSFSNTTRPQRNFRTSTFHRSTICPSLTLLPPSPKPYLTSQECHVRPVSTRHHRPTEHGSEASNRRAYCQT